MTSSSLSVPQEVVVNTRSVLLSSIKGVCLKRFNKDYKTLVGVFFPWKKHGFPSAIHMLQAMPEAVRFQYSGKDGDNRLYGIGTSDMFMPSWVVKAQGNFTPNNIHLNPSPLSNFNSGIRHESPNIPRGSLLGMPYMAKGNVYGPPGAVRGNARGPPANAHGPPGTARGNARGPPGTARGNAHGPPGTARGNARGPPGTARGNAHGPPGAVRGNAHGPPDTARGKDPSKRVFQYNQRGLVTVFLHWTPTTCNMGNILMETVSKIASPTETTVFKINKMFLRFTSIEVAESVVHHCNNLEMCGAHIRAEPANEKMPKIMTPPTTPPTKPPTKPLNNSITSPSQVVRSCDVTFTPDQRVASSDQRSHDTTDDEIRRSHDTTTAASSNDDLKDRVRRRYKQLEFELGLESDSCDEDDVSLFEWDDSLLDGITTLSSNNHTIESPLPAVTEIPSPLIESVTPLPPPLIGSVTPLPPLLIESVSPLPLLNPLSYSSLNSSTSSLTLTPSSLPPSCSSRSTTLSPFPPSTSSSTLSPLSPSSPHTLSPSPSPATLEHHEENSLELVYVSRVVSPDEIWLQKTPYPNGPLHQISQQILQEDPSKLGNTVKLGDLCCIDINSYRSLSPRKEATPPEMRRAFVCDNSEKHVTIPQVGLFLLDVGVTKDCPVENLFLLPPSLSPPSLPPLASPCALDGVVSTYSPDSMWFPFDVQMLWKYIHGKRIYLRPVQTPNRAGGGGCDLVDLYFDPCGEESVADKLVRESYNIKKGNRRRSDKEITTKNSEENTRQTESPSGPVLSNNGQGRKRRSLMSMVTLALKEL